MRAIVGTLLASCGLLLAMSACSSSQPETAAAPEPTPDPMAERWALARDAFRESDFDQTLTQLKILEERSSGGPGASNALAWQTLIHGGLARGYAEMILAAEQGIAESAPEVTGSLEVERGGYFRGARIYALQLLESASALESQLADSTTVRMDFRLPEGDHSPSPVLARMASGMKTDGSFMNEAVDYTLRRNMVLQAADLIGAHGELERARALFELPPVVVPRDVYFLGVAQTLFVAQDMFIDTRISNIEAREQVLAAAARYAEPATRSGGRTLQDAAADLFAQVRATQDDIAAEKRRLGITE